MIKTTDEKAPGLEKFLNSDWLKPVKNTLFSSLVVIYIPLLNLGDKAGANIFSKCLFYSSLNR